MNTLLEQRRQSLHRYVQQLTPDDLHIPFRRMHIECDAIMHGDHNLVVKLRIRGEGGKCLFRCLRIDGSDTMKYKQQEYECLTFIKGKAIGPQVFSWKPYPPMLIREWIEPITPLSEYLKGERVFFLRECAALYKRLHSIDILPHLSPTEKKQTPGSRYIDFISALTKAASENADRLEKWKKVFLQTLTSQRTRDVSMRGEPSITHLSPKDGNLVIYNGAPFFLDWDTVRFTDKERDIAVFIGMYIETPGEAHDFLRYFPYYNTRLIGRYLCPVMLWRELRGGGKLNLRRFHCLMEMEDAFS